MAFTYFFRDLQTIELAVKHLVDSSRGRSTVRIWDAGCAMGQEAYTLAIVLAESMGYFAFKNVRIDATDYDGSNLFGDIIANGVYPDEETQRIPRELFTKYFAACDDKPGHSRLIDLIRSRVVYRKHDLLSLDPPGNDYSLILCKNVLLHFQAGERVEVMKMYHRCLVPGGLFATEQTQKLPDELLDIFEPVVPDAQLYRRKLTS